jgi:hypothetical protein
MTLARAHIATNIRTVMTRGFLGRGIVTAGVAGPAAAAAAKEEGCGGGCCCGG